MTDVPACFRCDKQMSDAYPRDLWRIPAPSRGTLFISRGNYGSTLWDPGATPDRRYLLGVICDDCLVVLRGARQILIVNPSSEAEDPPEVLMWQEED
jgi:hypothetical protein